MALSLKVENGKPSVEDRGLEADFSDAGEDTAGLSCKSCHTYLLPMTRENEQHYLQEVGDCSIL